jgi:hypothetical protein
MRKVYAGKSISGISGLFDHFAMVATLHPGEDPAEVAKLYRCELVTKEEVMKANAPIVN